MIECLATISFVCLTQAASIEIGAWSSVLRLATVRAEGAEVAITLSTDNLLDLDATRMQRACSGDACVTYHKACVARPGRVQCEYSLAGRPFVPSLTLSAPDSETFARAERAIFFLAEPNAPQSAIPLTALSEVSMEPPPLCEDSEQAVRCPRRAGLY